ncbi:sugar transport protein [Cinnamomum micranthum f. kanehirae]|uniref:Sugar transport protein n=1 Tax=Cinnamomum micranthum f. kanehirae TaxID=337451 RepID=A0A443N6Y2_9MAGN|nr:sugar transport protein [Cinnamomum micranthum f. kanehirae]
MADSNPSKDVAPVSVFPKKPKRNKYALGCTVLASMSSILLGYDIGVMSGASIYIQKDMKLSDTKIEVITGILNVYSLIGSCAAGRTSDWLGRKLTIVYAAVIFFVGALMMGFATNYAFLMAGRFVAGVGVGYALMIAPVYTAEVSPASTRGFLTSFPDVFINAGIMFGYVSNYAFSHFSLHLGWRLMLGIGAIPSVFLALGVLAMPESPRWLIMQGRLGDAMKVLNKTSDSPEEAQLRLAEIKEAAGIPENCTDDVVPLPKCNKGEGVWKELLLRPTPAVRRILIAGAGLKRDNDLLGATVAVGFTKTCFILIATFFLDKVGRRPLLLSSVAGMVSSLAMLAVGLTVIDHHLDDRVVWAIALSILMVLAFVSSFSIGLGPVTWVYSSDIFPLKLRAQGTSLGVAVNRVMSGVVSMTFLSLSKAITIGGSFFLYCGVAAAAWVFFYTFLPETRGRTLENMECLFKRSMLKGGGGGGGGGEKVDGQVQLVNGGVTATNGHGHAQFDCC